MTGFIIFYTDKSGVVQRFERKKIKEARHTIKCLIKAHGIDRDSFKAMLGDDLSSQDVTNWVMCEIK